MAVKIVVALLTTVILFFMIMILKIGTGCKASLLQVQKIVQYCHLDERKILGVVPDTFLNRRLKWDAS